MTAAFHPSRDFHRASQQVAQRAPRATVTLAQPNYLVRRGVAVAVALAVVGAAAVMAGEALGAVSDLGGRPAAASEVSGDLVAPAVHVAGAGDTLWSIANRYRGDIDRGRYLDALIGLNGGNAILAGQAIRLP